MSNQIEQIRAEIERRIKELPACSTKTTEGAVAIRHRRIYEALISFIDALPAETVPADIETEIEQWWNERYAKVDKNYKFDSMSGHYIDNEGFVDLAHHFAEWGRKKVLQEINDGKYNVADKHIAAWLKDE